jgi:hypothetical protein
MAGPVCLLSVPKARLLRLVQRAHSASLATGMERRTRTRLCTVAQPNVPKKLRLRLHARAVLTAWQCMTVATCRAVLSIRTMNMVAVVACSVSYAAGDGCWAIYFSASTLDAFIASICAADLLIKILIIVTLAFAPFNHLRFRYDCSYNNLSSPISRSSSHFYEDTHGQRSRFCFLVSSGQHYNTYHHFILWSLSHYLFPSPRQFPNGLLYPFQRCIC